ncbi:MAG: hypothetical protein ACOC3G_03615, partial [Phycisphaeraceae bacterium]
FGALKVSVPVLVRRHPLREGGCQVHLGPLASRSLSSYFELMASGAESAFVLLRVHDEDRPLGSREVTVPPWLDMPLVSVS